MERTVAALTRHYPRRDEASQQALAVLNQFPSLVNPEQSDFTYDDGRVELLLSLTGVLPVPIGANTYHCPVAIWLPLDFPSKPPIVYVLPNETLQIRKGKHVDANGQVSVPYLDNWKRKSEGCSLMSLVNELIPVFSARYPLSPVQPKPKPPPSATNSSAVGPPPRPAPPVAAQSTQSIPPRPAPPPSVSPSGSTSFSSGPPPRPALPAQSATMGPGVPSRPHSTLYDQPARSTSLSLDGRSGAPVAPPPPPPPRVDGHAGSGIPPMGRTLPGSFSSPPPPAYPAQPPLNPPVPPPQRPVSVAYASPPPFDPSRGGIALPGQPQPDMTGQPRPPAPPLGWQPSDGLGTSTAPSPHPPVQVASPQPPQAGPPTFAVAGSPGFPAPVHMHNPEFAAGGAAPVSMATQSHHAMPPQAAPTPTTLPNPNAQYQEPPAHDPRTSDTRSFRPQEDRRSSLGSTQSFQSATPPQHAAPARAMAPGDAARSYSPAPSDTERVHSYASSARPPPQQYWSESTPIHARRSSTHSHLDHRTSQPPLPRSPPPPTHAASPLPPHLMYDRAQTHSPAPLSEVESHASSRTQEYDSVGANRARGPRAPGPPSEYSAAGEYGSFERSASTSTFSGPIYDAPTPTPPVQHAGGGPTRSMTVSYESRQPYDAYPVRDSDQAFEPVIEARSPPAPPQPPRPPVPSELPPPTPTASEYTAVSSAFVPQRQYTQQVDPTAYHAGYGPPPQLPQGPPLPAASMTSHSSSSAYGRADRPVTQPPYGHPGVNGFAPPIPVVAASPPPPVPRAARKARPASAAAAPPKPVNILDAADDDLESNAPPSSPSTVADPHAAAASVAGSDSISNVGGGGGARGAPSQAPPPVPPNPALLALRTRVHSKLTSALTHLAHSTEAELARLDLMRVDLEKAQPAIEDEMARLEAVRSVCAGVRDRYAQVVGEAQQRMREYEARGDGVDVDEIVCGSTVVYTQLLDLVAEDAALEDTIYALGRGLNSGGTANIDLDRFLKRVRALAKEQFVVRATINKILAGLAERRNARESQQLAGGGGGRTGTPNSAPDGGAGAHDGRGGRGSLANGA